jgi:hypothetical protein
VAEFVVLALEKAMQRKRLRGMIGICAIGFKPTGHETGSAFDIP